MKKPLITGLAALILASGTAIRNRVIPITLPYVTRAEAETDNRIPMYSENIKVGKKILRELTLFPPNTKMAIISSEKPQGLGFFLARAQYLVRNKTLIEERQTGKEVEGDLYTIFSGTFYDPSTYQLVSSLTDHNGKKIGRNNYKGGAKLVFDEDGYKLVDSIEKTESRSVAGLAWLVKNYKPHTKETKRRKGLYPNYPTWRTLVGVRDDGYLVHAIQRNATIDDLVKTAIALDLTEAAAADGGRVTAYYSPNLGIIKSSNKPNLKNMIVIYNIKCQN